MFTGKVIASAIGKKSPGLALGTEIFIAAGTAIYDALAARIAKIKRLEVSCTTTELKYAITHPLMSGIKIAKIKGYQPKEKNRQKPFKQVIGKGFYPFGLLCICQIADNEATNN